MFETNSFSKIIYLLIGLTLFAPVGQSLSCQPSYAGKKYGDLDYHIEILEESILQKIKLMPSDNMNAVPFPMIENLLLKNKKKISDHATRIEFLFGINDFIVRRHEQKIDVSTIEKLNKKIQKLYFISFLRALHYYRMPRSIKQKFTDLFKSLYAYKHINGSTQAPFRLILMKFISTVFYAHKKFVSSKTVRQNAILEACSSAVEEINIVYDKFKIEALGEFDKDSVLKQFDDFARYTKNRFFENKTLYERRASRRRLKKFAIASAVGATVVVAVAVVLAGTYATYKHGYLVKRIYEFRKDIKSDYNSSSPKENQDADKENGEMDRSWSAFFRALRSDGPVGMIKYGMEAWGGISEETKMKIFTPNKGSSAIGNAINLYLNEPDLAKKEEILNFYVEIINKRQEGQVKTSGVDDLINSYNSLEDKDKFINFVRDISRGVGITSDKIGEYVVSAVNAYVDKTGDVSEVEEDGNSSFDQWLPIIQSIPKDTLTKILTSVFTGLKDSGTYNVEDVGTIVEKIDTNLDKIIAAAGVGEKAANARDKVATVITKKTAKFREKVSNFWG